MAFWVSIGFPNERSGAALGCFALAVFDKFVNCPYGDEHGKGGENGGGVVVHGFLVGGCIA